MNGASGAGPRAVSKGNTRPARAPDQSAVGRVPPRGARTAGNSASQRPGTAGWFPLPLLAALALSGHAAAPVLEHFHPVGLPRGTTNALVRLTGKADPWPPRIWTSAPGLSFLAETNSGRFRVDVATNAPTGAHLVRLFHDEGASEPRVFVVGGGPEVLEVEPNDRFTAAQSVTDLPVTVTGRLDRNGDVDSFALRLRAGQWLDAPLDAFVLMSKLDPVLRLVTPQGVPLAWNHDFATLDPRLRWRADADQNVVLQVFGFRYPGESAIQLAGGDHAVYRLHLAVSDAPPADRDYVGTVAEIEPNNAPDQAQPTALPWNLAGTLATDGDVDRFQFVVPSNAPPSTLDLEVHAAALGSPLDAWVRVTDAAGKELAHNDDFEGSRDPHLLWKPPGPGTYQLAVGSLVQRGSPAHRYRLVARPVPPGFEARLDASQLVVKAGATNELKFKVARLHGHDREIEVGPRDLPASVHAASVRLKPNQSDVTLAFVAATNAAAFSGPIRIGMTSTNAGDDTVAERFAEFFLTSRGENNGVPQGWASLLADRTDRLWVTVQPPPPPPTPPPPATNTPAGKQ